MVACTVRRRNYYLTGRIVRGLTSVAIRVCEGPSGETVEKPIVLRKSAKDLYDLQWPLICKKRAYLCEAVKQSLEAKADECWIEA